MAGHTDKDEKSDGTMIDINKSVIKTWGTM